MSWRICSIGLEICWITMVFMARGSVSIKGLRIIVPEVVKSGETVTLTCDYDLEEVALYSINWYWNGHEFYRFVPKEDPPYRDFAVTHFNIDLFKSGPTRVTLRGVRRELSGRYECEVSGDAPLFHTGHGSATMMVAEVSADDPTINIHPERVEIGTLLRAECTAPGSDPPANLTWIINDEQILEDNESVKVYPTEMETDAALGLHSTTTKIDVITNRSHFLNGLMFLKCEANVFTLWNRSTEIQIVEFVPQQLAPVLGSMSSQSQTNNQGEEIQIPGGSTRPSHAHRILTISLTFILFIRR